MNEQFVALLPQIGTWLGIVNQLHSSRMTQLLGKHNFTIVQFALLNHLARQQDTPQTITDLTNALEVNQPGVTKIVQKLARLDLIVIEKDPKDSRKRLISISQRGRETLRAVMLELAPDYVACFAEWELDRLTEFLAQLQKLGTWLDNNRLA
ncbi:MAG: MarR family winged helix-turn-helix transcriptional regulator [Candidatus Promineifilaceae bacterium]